MLLSISINANALHNILNKERWKNFLNKEMSHGHVVTAIHLMPIVYTDFFFF